MKLFWLVLAFLPVLALGDELSTSWILTQLDRPGVTTVESLLARFSPKSLERHVLVYGSESQQFASFRSPRVIVYSYDADFLMAFNGEPGSKGFHELEILRFDHDHSAFRAEVIRFDPAGKAKATYDPAPTECARCHQSDLRPNWEPYFHWVGLYGSEDDNQNAGNDHPGQVLRRGREYEELQAFRARQQREVSEGRGRYRFLPKHPAARPNADLDDRMACLNMKRMVRALLAHPESKDIWPHLDRARINVYDLPQALLSRARRSYADVAVETERVMQEAMRARIARHRLLTGAGPQGRARTIETSDRYSSSYDIDVVASWRFVFEEILHEPFRPYSTSRHFDYHLNLGSITSLTSIAAMSTTDRGTGAVVLNREPGERPRGPYGYDCPRSPHYFDGRLIPPKR